MARFCGVIGYGETAENPPGSGVYRDIIVEYTYYGDVVRNSRLSREGEYLNNDLAVNNSISIVADAYAHDNFHAIRYVKWNGVYWDVPTVEVQAPRLVLQLGGVYNGETAPSAPSAP